MIVVDSYIWIDYFNGTISKETDWLDESLGIELIIMGDIILAEDRNERNESVRPAHLMKMIIEKDVCIGH